MPWGSTLRAARVKMHFMESQFTQFLRIHDPLSPRVHQRLRRVCAKHRAGGFHTAQWLTEWDWGWWVRILPLRELAA